VARAEGVVRVPILTVEEERECLAKMDKRSIHRLIMAQTGEVIAVANAYHKRLPSIPVQDLVQEGYLGAYKALEKWDHTRENRFHTYAKFWIFHAIQRYTQMWADTVRVPIYAQKGKLKSTSEALEYDDTGEEKFADTSIPNPEAHALALERRKLAREWLDSAPLRTTQREALYATSGMIDGVGTTSAGGAERHGITRQAYNLRANSAHRKMKKYSDGMTMDKVMGK